MHLNFFFYYISLIPPTLLVLLPFSLVLGPFLPDLTVVIISIYFLINIFKKKYFFLVKNYYFIFFILFCFYLIAISINSTNINLSLSSSLFYFRFGLFALGVYILLDNYSFIKNYLLYSFFILFSFLIIDSYFQLIFGYNIMGNPIFQNNRVTSIFGDEIKLGSFISRLSPIYFGLILLYFKKNKYLFHVFFFIYFISISVIFLTGERVAFVYIIIAFILLFLTNLQIYKIFLFYILLTFLMILLASFYYPFLIERMITLTIIQMNLANGLFTNSNYDIITGDKLIIFSIPHEQHFLTAFKIFQDNLFFGAGPKMFRELCFYEIYNSGIHSCSTHPHNTYIQLLAETGLIGFIIIFLIFIYISYNIIIQIYRAIRYKENFNNKFKFTLYLCIFISLFPLVPTGNFFNNWLSVIYYLPIGFILFENIKSNIK